MRAFFLFLFLLAETAAFGALKLQTLADKAVTTAGTEVQITSSAILAYSVCVQAKKANTGKIYIGDSSVSSTQGHQLEPGETYCIEGPPMPSGLEEIVLSDIYVDSSVNGEGVKITYFVRRN